MKICIPVSGANGLASAVAAILPQTSCLHIHDLDAGAFEEIDLGERARQAAERPVVPDFDAVICASVDVRVFRALRQQGKQVYLTEATTVEQALAEFGRGEAFRVPDNAGGCGGGCHGHGGDEHAHGACHGHAAQESGHSHGGGCGGHGEGGCGGCCGGAAAEEAPAQRERDDIVRIAVTSQNRKTVTEHAGQCRKFWIYETRGGQVLGKTLLELPREASFHASPAGVEHPLDDIDVLITAGIGDGLRQRLARRGIQAVVVGADLDPDAAVASLLADA